jgi:hypothetical protein
MSSLQKLDTILYEVQQACIQMSLPPPSGVYDSADENAQLMGSAANLAGVMISEAFDWQALRKTFTANGDGVRSAWDLPSNFSRFVDGTGWSTAIRRPVVILNAQQSASIKAWYSQNFYVSPACRIIADQLAFLSAPANGDKITFEYIDANWVLDADDNTITKQKATKNGDIPRFDWLLMLLAVKVKWKEQKGMNTTAEQSDFNDRLLQLTQRDEMGQVLTLSGPVPGAYRYLDNWLNSPDSGFGL